MPELEPFKKGDVVADKYEIERVLGEGGMGIVYAARHKALGEKVALKCLRASLSDNPESQARFAREARTANRLKDQHVARVLDAGTDDGVPYMVMEYLEGEDLARVLRDGGPLPAAEAVDLLLQACEAIAEAHKLGIVHRDLKPANLFRTRGPDGSPLVKVLDFGIAKSTSPGDPSVTAGAALLGSPLYMSPEQLVSSGTVDARADVWSLGVILYEMLTGKRPFAGDSHGKILEAILVGTYTPPSKLRPGVPAALESAIAEALAREAASRPSTVAAFAARIAPCGSDAGRASCRRIEGIAAARVPELPAPVAQEEAGGTTVQQAPPSLVARAPGPPGEVTQAPAFTKSVSAPARHSRSRPRVARVLTVVTGFAAAAAAIAGAVVGAQRGWFSSSGQSPAQAPGGDTVAVPADSATPVGSAAASSAPSAASAAAATSAAPADPADRGRGAVPLSVDGFDLGDFDVADSPSPEHPRGVIAVLGFTKDAGEHPGISLLAIDVASGRDFARRDVGFYTYGDTVKVARTRRGVVTAWQSTKALELRWFTEASIDDADTRSFPRLAAKRPYDLRGFAVFDDRVVLATDGHGTTTLWILDEKGNLLGSHACRGGLFEPGDAELVRSGDNVVVTNFNMTEPDGVPVCAGSLHGPPRWREVTLHGGRLDVREDGVYFATSGGADRATIRALDENLAPTGLPPRKPHPLDAAPCTGLTGTIQQRAEEVGGVRIIHMVACCGDEGGGLFLCGSTGHGP